MDRNRSLHTNTPAAVIWSLMLGWNEEKVAYFQLVLTTNIPSVVNSVNPSMELCKVSLPPSFVCSWLTKKGKKWKYIS